MIDGRKDFDQSVIYYIAVSENTLEIDTGQGNDYTTVCLLDYSYFKEIYKLIAIELSKRQALIQQSTSNTTN